MNGGGREISTTNSKTFTMGPKFLKSSIYIFFQIYYDYQTIFSIQVNNHQNYLFYSIAKRLLKTSIANMLTVHSTLQWLPFFFELLKYAVLYSKVRGRFRKILRPSQNIWTLPDKEITGKYVAMFWLDYQNIELVW